MLRVLLQAEIGRDAGLTWAGVPPRCPSADMGLVRTHPASASERRLPMRGALCVSFAVHVAACVVWLSLDTRSPPMPPLATLDVELLAALPMAEPAQAPALASAFAPEPSEAVAVAPEAPPAATPPAAALVAPALPPIMEPISPEASPAPRPAMPLRAESPRSVPAAASPPAASASPPRAKSPPEVRAGPVRPMSRQVPAAAQADPSMVALAAPPVRPAVVAPAHPIAGLASNRQPIYPEAALRRGDEGVVVLRVAVTVDGAANAVSVLRSSGHDTLDAAAVTAVRQWRFVPATRDGAPVEAFADVPFAFRVSR